MAASRDGGRPWAASMPAARQDECGGESSRLSTESWSITHAIAAATAAAVASSGVGVICICIARIIRHLPARLARCDLTSIDIEVQYAESACHGMKLASY